MAKISPRIAASAVTTAEISMVCFWSRITLPALQNTCVSMSARMASIFWMNSSRSDSIAFISCLAPSKSCAFNSPRNRAAASSMRRSRSLAASSIRVSIRANAALSEGVPGSSMIETISLRAAPRVLVDLGAELSKFRSRSA